jgi:hypothetical protein
MSAVPPAQRKRQVQSSIADCVTSVIQNGRQNYLQRYCEQQGISLSEADQARPCLICIA